MKFPIRQLPTIQNWSCHRSGNCCREFYVGVTPDEKQRIEQQGWVDRPEFKGTDLFAPVGPFWRREYRLAQRENGNCVFLNEQGLCRIHAEFGEAAKPIACRLYPYMIVPAGEELRVSVRFSCPSAARNLGRPVTEQAGEIRRYAESLVPAGARAPEPPPLRSGQRLDWPDLLRVVRVLEDIIAQPGAELVQRMIRAVSFVRLLEQARVTKLGREQFQELLGMLKAAVEQGEATEASAEPCAGWALTLFRLTVAQCARKDLAPHLRRGLRGRLGLLRAAWRFMAGRGPIPQLQPIFAPVDFDTVEQPFGPIPAEASRILERYYRIKLQGVQFFGSVFYNMPLVEGFYSLALTLPAILWIARWLAAGAGRTELTDDDVITSLTVVDHQWGFAPVFGFAYARWRVRLLASQGQVERIVQRYAGGDG